MQKFSIFLAEDSWDIRVHNAISFINIIMSCKQAVCVMKIHEGRSLVDYIDMTCCLFCTILNGSF